MRWAIENHPAMGRPADLGRALEVSSAYVSELLKRDSAPGKKALGRLAGALGVPMAWLAYGAPSNGSIDSDAEFWREYRRIEASDMPEEWKILKVDALSAALRQLTQARDSAAAEARTRIMEVDARTASGRRRDVRTPRSKPRAKPSTGGKRERGGG